MSVDRLVVGEVFEDLVFDDLPRFPRIGEEPKTESFQRAVGGGAFLAATADGRVDALAAHPLVADRELAARLLARLGLPA